MFRVVGEDRRVGAPVLVELRGELDEVAGYGGSGQRWILRGGEEAVEGVAELVEEGGDVVEGQERGLAFCGLRDVRDVVDDGQGAEKSGLMDERGHPGATVFVVALEGIEVKEREGLVVGVG